MPIYEFECPDCGHVFDRLQKLSDADPRDCPQCGKVRVHRRLTAPAFRLAGTGWYETDFKKDGDKKHNLASRDDAPKAESKAAEKTDAKPATATAPDKPATAASKPTAKKAEAGTRKSAQKPSGNAA